MPTAERVRGRAAFVLLQVQGVFLRITLLLTTYSTCCLQEAWKGLDHKSLSQDIVKHAQYHYNPGRDVVFRGEFIPVRITSCHLLHVLEPSKPGHCLRLCAVRSDADRCMCAFCRRASLRYVISGLTVSSIYMCHAAPAQPALGTRLSTDTAMLLQGVVILIWAVEVLGLFFLVLEVCLKLKRVGTELMQPRETRLHTIDLTLTVVDLELNMCP